MYRKPSSMGSMGGRRTPGFVKSLKRETNVKRRRQGRQECKEQQDS